MLEVEKRSSVTAVRLAHGKVDGLDPGLLQSITAVLWIP